MVEVVVVVVGLVKIVVVVVIIIIKMIIIIIIAVVVSAAKYLDPILLFIPVLSILGFKIALLQMFVEFHREQNLIKAAKMIKEAANHGAKVVALPVR